MILLYLNYAFFFFFFFYFLERKKGTGYILIGFTLTFYHFLFGYLNVLSSQEKVVDSINYYTWGTTSAINYFEFSIGSSFIVHIVNWLSLFFSSFEQMSAFFTGLSLLSLLKLFSISYSGYRKSNISTSDFFILVLFLFLPGFHYWTVSLGKDSLSLISIFFGFYSFYNKKILPLILSCLIMFFVRVHIFAIFMLSLIISEYYFAYFRFFKIKEKNYKMILLSISIPFAIGMFLFLFNYIQRYSSDGFANLDEFFDSRAEVYADLGSGAWLSVQPYPVKLFAFIFGGVPWISIDALTLVSMLEGIVLFVIILYVLSSLKKNLKYFCLRDKATTLSILIFVLILILFFALTNNNLGVMVRMKIMIYSPLLLLSQIVLSNKLRR